MTSRIDLAAIQPADIVAVRSSGLAGVLIRFGSALQNEPNLSGHVAVFDHWTGQVPWFIEGRPGGVGWRDGRDYLSSPWTVTNIGQPKTQRQRDQVLGAVRAAIGTPYDWDAIAKDAADALHLPSLFASEKWGPKTPGHVVCSSLAAWGHYKGALAYPGQHSLAEVTPGDWDEFCLTRAWERQ